MQNTAFPLIADGGNSNCSVLQFELRSVAIGINCGWLQLELVMVLSDWLGVDVSKTKMTILKIKYLCVY